MTSDNHPMKREPSSDSEEARERRVNKQMKKKNDINVATVTFIFRCNSGML